MSSMTWDSRACALGSGGAPSANHSVHVRYTALSYLWSAVLARLGRNFADARSTVATMK